MQWWLMGQTSNTPVSDEELLSVFRESENPFLTANDVAEEVSIGRRHVHDRLMRLAEDGELETRTVGARARAWWLP
jgi:DNA-binding Lrp family transcriptional regulator